MSINQPIQFKPIYQPRVWGGRWLAERFNRKLPGSAPIGESWEIVDRPEAQSVCTRTGKTLRELLEEYPEQIMGPGFDPAQPFPILVKWLDCSQRLSLQVHPPESVAKELRGEPKTEFWYVADTKPGAGLYVGLRHGVSRLMFERAIAEKALEPLLHRIPVKPGESMILESGRLHAIDAGNLILEIQQNSDTTYRVYDWGRKGLDGRPRELHVAESLRSIRFDDYEPQAENSPKPSEIRELAACACFRVNHMPLGTGQQLNSGDLDRVTILTVVSGMVRNKTNGGEYPPGTVLLLPYAWEGTLESTTDTRMLLADSVPHK